MVNHQFDPAFSRDGRYHAFGRSSTSPQMVLVIEDTREKKDAVFQPRESRATARIPRSPPMARAWCSASPISAAIRSPPSILKARN